ncbi:hypothetical protein DERP_005778, partial [Dermatophagoides pteronyssinus]
MAKHKKRLAQPAQVAVNSDSEYEQPSVNRNPRNANEADETLENLHQDSSPIATYNIQQCCDTLKCFNKMHDKRSVTKYLDLLDTISNTLLTIAHNYEQNDSKIHNILEELKQDIKNKPASPTYSQVLQRNPQTTQISIPKYDEKTIIVKPNDSTPPQIIENKIKEIIKKSNTKTKINSIYSKQTCVIIKTPNNDKDCDQLLNQINSDEETKHTCNAYEPKKRDPTILIKNVASDTDLLKLAEQIAECNPELEGLEDDMEYLFKLKYSDTAKHMNVVLKTSPKTIIECISVLSSSFIVIEMTSHSVRFLQQNARKSLIATKEILNNINYSKPDIVLIQEPYTSNSNQMLDFNSRHHLWHDTTTNNQGIILAELINDYELSIHNTKDPTCITTNGSSIIDLTLTNNKASSYIIDWHSSKQPNSIFDHVSISFTYNHQQRIPTKTINSTSKFNENKADWQKFKDCFNSDVFNQLNISINNIQHTQDIDKCALDLTKFIQEAAYKSIPTKKHNPRKNYTPWWDKDLTLMQITVRNLRNLYSHEKNTIVKQMKYEQYKRYRNKYVRAIYNKKQQKWREFLEESSSSNTWGNTYKMIKATTNPKTYTLPILDNAQPHQHGTIIENILDAIFPDDNQLLQHTPTQTSNILNQEQLTITPEYIETLIKSTNNKKSPGPDYITNQILFWCL